MKVRLHTGTAVIVAEAIGGLVAVTITGEAPRIKTGGTLSPEDRARLDAVLSGVVSVVIDPEGAQALAQSLAELATIAQEQAYHEDLAAVAQVLPHELAAKLVEGGHA